MFDFELEHIFSYTATLKSTPEVIGPLAEGIRANFYVTGGTVNGPKVKGKVLAVGGDWLTLRRDGVGILDVRATLETDDGALIYTAYSGVVDLGENGHEKFLKQELPERANLRIVPRYYTAHPDYQWLNRIQCIGIGQVDFSRFEVGYDIYRLK